MVDIFKQSYGMYAIAREEQISRLKIAIDELKDNQKVLEIGVGYGSFTRNVSAYKKIDLCAVDVAEQALQNVKPWIKDSQLVDISIGQLKFSDNQFDSVVCLEVFEHLQNPSHALAEIQRVLKPCGKLIASIPNYWGGHLMIYPGFITPKFFREFLRQNFFRIEKFVPWGPVWNKDNVGKWLDLRIENKLFVLILLRIIQIGIRVLQFLTRLLGLKFTALYWCYFFVCENKKDQMQEPVWLRQLCGSSEENRHKGWYDSEYHQKALKRRV